MKHSELLIELDKDFSRRVNSNNVKEWTNTFCYDGKMILSNGDLVTGNAEIEKLMKSVITDNLIKFEWSPFLGEVSDSEDMGVTVGKYVKTIIGENNQLINTTGTYMTIWKKTESGEYKVFMDIGN
jgi:ketosteroid isomerase-like protein